MVISALSAIFCVLRIFNRFQRAWIGPAKVLKPQPGIGGDAWA